MHTPYKNSWLALFVTALLIGVMTISASANEVKLQNDEIRITDSANTMTGPDNNGVITATASGGLFSQKTNTINIYNETGSEAKLTFTYSASNYSSFSESTKGDAGPYEAVLGVGENVTLSIKGKRAISNNTATLTMSGVTLQVMAGASDVTFAYDSACGSVTAGGTAVADGSVVEIASSGASLVASPVSGATFYGWVDANGSIISTSASYTLQPAADMTVKAVFGSSEKPCFGVGTAVTQQHSTALGMTKHTHYAVGGYEYLFDDLNAAGAAAAASGTAKTVVLLNDATLSAGAYTIPVGVTLLIPFNASNTMYTTEPEHVETTTEVPSTVYRTLTLGENAAITVNGSISVSAKHKHIDGDYCEGGYPSGAVGMVKMAKNSSITVNNGGSLYAWGYITALSQSNEGSITAKSGAKVYETFQIMDYRGGSQSSEMENGVFPISQYYVQNIEVPLELEAGAEELCATTMYGSYITVFSTFTFLGTGAEGHMGMFNITSGSVTKHYNGSRDRLELTVEGDMDVATLTLKLNPTSDDGLSSKDYVLGINNNITVHVESGTLTITQDIALLPGCELFVGEDAKVVLGNNGNGVPSSVYIYDADQWGNFCYTEGIPAAQTGSVKLVPTRYAPGRTYTRTAADLQDVLLKINGEVDASGGYIYTTTGGANVCSDGGGKITTTAGETAVTYQFVQSSKAYTEIAVNPVYLKNANGSFVHSSSDTYTYHEGFWHKSTCTGWGANPQCGCGHQAVAAVVTEANKSISRDYHGTLAATVGAYTSATGYIEMQTGTTEAAIAGSGKTVYLDLNGRSVTVDNFTVDALNGMDTATNSFGQVVTGQAYTPGTIKGTITGTVANVYDCEVGTNANKLYAAYYDSTAGTYSFHRVRFGVKSYTYYTQNGALLDALTVSALYMSDAKGLKTMTDFGMAINAADPVWYGGKTVVAGKFENVSHETEGMTPVNGYLLTGHATGIGTGNAISAAAAVEIRDADVAQNEYVLTRTMVLNSLQGG